jgi:uncharacterized repeat protein (TIGR02543 family)
MLIIEQTIMNVFLLKKRKSKNHKKSINPRLRQLTFGSVFAFLLLMSGGVFGQATLPITGVTGMSRNSLPTGFTHTGLGSDYSNNMTGCSTSIKFDTTNDFLLLYFDSAPSELTFNIKGNGFSGGNIKVEQSPDNSAWSTIATITSIAGTAAGDSYSFASLSATSRYIRWTYTKSSGNVAMCSVNLSKVSGPCLGTPTPENTIASPASVASGGTTELSLQNATTGLGVTYQWQQSADGSTGWTNVSGTGTNATYTATVTAKTYYRCQVTCSGATGTSANVEVSLAACTSNPSSNDGNGINSVTVGSSTFSVADVTYYNYTATTPNLTQGASITSSITFATGYSYDSHIWIDFNDDLVFDNATEKVYTGESLAANPTTLTTSFTLGSSVALGTHKMRIGTADSGQLTPNPCYNGDYGVTVDMNVTIISAGQTVTFNGNGSTGGTMANQTASTATALTTNTFTRTNYTFAGWNTAVNGSGTAYADGASYPFVSNATLYAQWTGNVSYDANGGTGTVTDATAYLAGASITTASGAGFTRSGFTLIGWNTLANGLGSSYTLSEVGAFTFAGNTTLYAVWNPVGSKTVIFEANGGTGIMANQTESAATNLTSNSFTRTGYSFANWNTASDGSGTTYTNGQSYDFSANITLYAQWTATNNTVTFNGNGSTSGSMSNQTIATDATAALTTNTYSRTGYTFASWNTLADGSGTTYADGAPYTMGTANVTLYARWTANNNTITFDGNGSTAGSMSNQTIATAATATLTTNAYTRTGYTFASWNTLADGSGTTYTDGASYTMGTSSVTLYAQWDVYVGPWEDFETGTKGSYASGTATCTAGEWTFDDALIGTSGSDRKNGSKSARIRNAGSIYTNFDIAGGVGVVKVQHAIYGSDTSSSWRLVASTDGGTTWTAYVSSDVTTSSTTLNEATFTVNLSGNVRLKIEKYSNSERLSIDDIYKTSFAACASPTVALQVTPVTSIATTTVTLNGNVTVEGGAAINTRGFEYSVSSNMSASTTKSTGATATGTYSENLTGLVANTLYYYRGYAVNDCTPNKTGYTATSSYPTFTTLHNAPTVGTGSGAASNSFTANWTAPTGGGASFTYEIQVDDDSGFGSVDYTDSGIVGLSVSATGLLASTTYYYRVRAVNAGGNSGWSSVSVGYATLAPAPEINIVQGATSIASSEVYSFGNQTVSTSSSAVTFTVQNTGTAALSVGALSISGAGAAAYSITQPLSSSVAASGTTTFTVTFSPTTLGAKAAQLSLINGDADEDPYIIGLNGWGMASAASDIITDGTFIYSSTIDYKNYITADITSGNSVELGRFTIRDGGGTDADDLATLVNALSFTVGNSANLQRLAIYDGATEVAEVAAGGTTNFTGLTLTATDNSTKTFTIRGSFNTSITDNQRITLTIASASADAAGSGFGTISATTSVTGTNNVLVVTADRLTFTTQATPTNLNAAMATVVVAATDVHSNVDVDQTGTVVITSTGTLTGSPVSVALSSGAASFTSLTHTVAQTGRTLSATLSGLTSATSVAFDITEVFCAPIWEEDFDAGCVDIAHIPSVMTNWTRFSGSGSDAKYNAAGLSYSGYTNSGIGGAFEFAAGGGDDIKRVFSAGGINSGAVYASFLVNMDASSSTSDDYFVILMGDPGSNSFNGRVFTKKVGTQFQLGIGKQSSSASDVNTGLLNFGTTYLVVLKYEFIAGGANDPFKLWVISSGIPTNEASAGTAITATLSGTDATNLKSFGLRQTNKPKGFVDGIRIGTTWADVVCGAAPASKNYTWTGGASTTSWNDAANWSPSGIPSSKDHITINTAPANLLNITTCRSVQNFTLNGTGNFNMSATGSLTIDGDVTYGGTATATLNCDSTVNITSTSSQLIPPLNYGNLEALGGDRTFSPTGTIGICAGFNVDPDLHSYTVTGSTVNYFSSSSGWVMKPFTYDNLTFSGTGDFSVGYSSPAVNKTITVLGDYLQTAGTVYIGDTSSATGTLNVDGNVTITGGNLAVNEISGGTGNLNIKGDLVVHSGATLAANAASTATVNFTGTGDGTTDATTQTIDMVNVSTASKIVFNVNSGTYVKLINQNFVLGASSKLTVKSGGTFNFGFNGITPLTLSGPAFELETGGTIKITSADGIASSGATGNIRTTTQTIASGTPYAKFHYIGKGNQATGNALPATVADFVVNNTGTAPANEVALANPIIVNTSLSILSGVLNLNEQTASGASLDIANDATLKIAGTATFPTGFSSKTFAANSIVEYGGANQVIAALTAPTYAKLKVSGTGTKTLETSAVEVGNTVEVTASLLKIEEGKTLSVANEITTADTDVVPKTDDIDYVAPTIGITIDNGGSLVQTTTVDNQLGNLNVGKINMQRITQKMYRFDYTYWSSPVFGNNDAILDLGEFTLFNLSPNTPYHKFFEFNPTPAVGSPNWEVITNGAKSMNPGRGYIVRAPISYGVDSEDIDSYEAFSGHFIGRPNNGTVSVAVEGTDVEEDPLVWNLIGNPYPSAIDGDAFLDENVGGTNDILGGTLYFWTHNTPLTTDYATADYASWNSMGGTATVGTDGISDNEVTPTGKIAAGQAFFVKGTADGDAVFNNDMREKANNMQFFKSTPEALTTSTPSEKHRVWLNLAGATSGFSQMLVGYTANATNGYDIRYDGESFGGNQVTFYSINNAKNLVIQGRAVPFVTTDEVPLGYKTTLTGNLTISIDHTDGSLATQTIYLKDNVLDVVHNLTDADYVFAAVPGTFNDRFVLRYLPAENLANPTFEEQISNVTIRKNDATLRINSPYETIEAVMVYDIMGRLVFEQKDCNTNTFEASHIVYSEQTLIVKVRLSNGGVVTKKVL